MYETRGTLPQPTNIQTKIATGHTLLGLVLVARDTNILSCFAWSRGRVTNSCSQGRRFKSWLARLTSLEERCSMVTMSGQTCCERSMSPSLLGDGRTIKVGKRKCFEKCNPDAVGHFYTFLQRTMMTILVTLFPLTIPGWRSGTGISPPGRHWRSAGSGCRQSPGRTGRPAPGRGSRPPRR